MHNKSSVRNASSNDNTTTTSELTINTNKQGLKGAWRKNEFHNQRKSMLQCSLKHEENTKTLTAII